MTQPEMYVVGMLIVLLACAYGAMCWNRSIIRRHKALEQKGDSPQV